MSRSATLRAARLRLAAAMLAFALLFGWFFARAVQPYQQPAPSPEWGTAEWIAPAEPAAVTYYRASVLLPATPESAYLALAAPDGYRAYVNGTPVGDASAASAVAFERIDVAAALRPGRNVLAVRVARSTFPGLPALRARLVWRDRAGSSGEFGTSAGWRYAPRQERAGSDGAAWTDPAFDDSPWPAVRPATALGAPLRSTAPWAAPAMFEHFPQGQWLAATNVAGLGTVFRREWTLAGGPIDHAWIGIAGTGTYTLSVNDVRFETQAATTGEMAVGDLAPYLQAGRNRVEVDVSSIAEDSRLAVSLAVEQGGMVADLSSDAHWQARMADGQWQDAQPVGDLRSGGFGVAAAEGAGAPQLRTVDLHVAGGLRLPHAATALAAAGAALLAGILLLRLVGPAGLASRSHQLDACALPFALGALLLAGCLVVALDLRVATAAIFTPVVAAALAVFTAGGCALVALEARRAGE